MLNPKQYKKYWDAFVKRQEHEFNKADKLNHLLGYYISYAFNNPKKYPKEPFTHKQESPNKIMSSEQMLNMLKAFNTKIGGEVRHGN